MPPTAAIVLAAGLGKRMRSATPKVLHSVGGRPMLASAISAALARRTAPVVVVVDPVRGPAVRAAMAGLFPTAPLRFAVQKKPRGTGDATRAGLAALGKGTGDVLILYGDVPLLTGKTLAQLARAKKASRVAVAFLTALVDDPTGYGRVVRASGRPVRIVEHKDASRAERAIHEINAGVYLCDRALLDRALGGLSRANAQGELYLTDVVALAAKGAGAVGVVVGDPDEIRGVNDRWELALAERLLRLRLIREHGRRGVTFADPESTLVEWAVRLGRDAHIGPQVQLCGKTRIGPGARIEGPAVLIDSTVAAGATIHAFSHLEGATVAEGAHIGPYARLRPEAVIEAEARVGNFVEVKKSRLGRGAKANHLAYLGDTRVGAGANIGAGTITCNYDGHQKHRTRIGQRVFVGSNSTLVAPVEIGPGAYVAAGSVITRAVPKDALAFGRARQENLPGRAARLRTRLAQGKSKS